MKLFAWFRRRTDRLRLPSPSTASASLPAIPDGERVYAIGDVHGRADLLADLLERIRRDHVARGPADATVILLGDLIDRGPASRGVIELLFDRAPAWATLRFVTGNHEEAMKRSFTVDEDPRSTGWMRFGGRETLTSYGVPEATFEHHGVLFAEEVRRCIPDAHFAFLARFEDMVRIGDYAFVHAGIRPGVPLDRQSGRDLRWIRHEFLDSTRRHEAMIVHGHTVVPAVDERPNRINVDTGAYKSGVLSAIGLCGTERWVVQTEPATVAEPVSQSQAA